MATRHSLHVTARLLLAAAAFTLGSLAVNAGLSSAASPRALQRPSAGTAPGVQTPLIYVSNYQTNSITAYPSGASGDVRPVLTIAGPHTRLNYGVGALAHDTEGRLFVASQDEVLVFAPGANGDAAPLRYFQTLHFPYDFDQGGIPGSLAVDRNDNTYVGLYPNSSHAGCIVGVYGPTAQGANALLRTLYVGSCGQESLAVGVDRAGNLYAAKPVDPQGGAVPTLTKFAPFAAGNVPVSRVGGGANDFSSAAGLAVSPLSGNVYILNGGTGGTQSITIFDPAFTRIVGSIPVSAFGKGYLAPAGISIDGTNNVYIATPQNLIPQGPVNSVEVLAVVGNKLVSSRAIVGPHTGLSGPSGITFIDSHW